jgi:hypothetical protein
MPLHIETPLIESHLISHMGFASAPLALTPLGLFTPTGFELVFHDNRLLRRWKIQKTSVSAPDATRMHSYISKPVAQESRLEVSSETRASV